MKHSIVLLSIVATFLAMGCSKGAPHQSGPEALTQICPISIRHENSDGTLEEFPFIRPEHVASISPAKPFFEGESAMWVELTVAGSKRMYSETKSSVGSRIAFFCGKKEFERATIQAPIKDRFRVARQSSA
jgi:hypothetical protein